jgi:membrane protein
MFMSLLLSLVMATSSLKSPQESGAAPAPSPHSLAPDPIPHPAIAPMDRVRALRHTSWGRRVVQLFGFAAARASEERIGQVAASLTFTTVLSLVPLFAVVLALFTAFPLFEEFRTALEQYLVTSLMPVAIAESIMGYLNQFASAASRLTAIGGIFLVITSVSLMLTIDKALNEIWHVRKARPLPQRILVYWAALTLGPVLLGASLWISGFLARESLGLVGDVSPAIGVLLSFLPLVLTGVGFAALFVVVPNRQIPWGDALTGGFTAAAVLELMKAAFAYYVTRFPTYTMLYGAFATLPIFLLWVYLSWLVTLFGAALAASLPMIRIGRWDRTPRAGAAFIDAVRVLKALTSERGSIPPGLSTAVLGTRLRLNHDELVMVLDTLQGIGYVARLGEGNKERWALVCDPSQAALGPLIDALLLDRGQPTIREEPELLAAAGLAWQADGVVCLAELLDGHPDGNDAVASTDPAAKVAEEIAAEAANEPGGMSGAVSGAALAAGAAAVILRV